MADASIKTYNHDIVGFWNRINRFIIELMKSASSGVNAMNDYDQQRLVSYLNALKLFHAWCVGAPQLDLVETHPREYVLEAAPAILPIENEAIDDLIRLFVIARDELVNSQSSRNACGLISFDSLRFTSVLFKAEKFLTEYVKVATPLDCPESAPSSPMTGSGKIGV